MAKLKSSLINMFLSLFIICLVAGTILAMVNEYTKGPIEDSKKIKLENAIREVVPEFDNSPAEEAFWTKINDADSLKIYPAKKEGKDIGAAIESNSMNGFGGEVKIIAGFNVEGKLLNYVVLQHAETPGLGDKMGFWFKQDKNRQNIIGSDMKEGVLKVSKDGGTVDAITAATISSRAFLDAINRAYAAYSGNISDASSGATTTSGDGVSGATGKQ
ncbi:MAG: RnfABCDGE type electron transport complex subunit G [Dysgonamonadaceae bacterium]|jgi:electron transport complex protein RnfG|nr:RnfABCDGE type electron transport complex subunit G [Dysgonamonadaceae bacterium]